MGRRQFHACFVGLMAVFLLPTAMCANATKLIMKFSLLEIKLWRNYVLIIASNEMI